MAKYINVYDIIVGKIPYDSDLTDYQRGWNDALDSIAVNAPSSDVVPWKFLERFANVFVTPQFIREAKLMYEDIESD